MKHTLSIFLIGILTLLTAAGCRQGSQTDSRPRIMVSIEPLRYFAEQIAGNHFEVISLVPKGFSPETYEPTPQQMIQLSESKAFFKVGNLGFETTWLPQIASNMPNLPVINTSAHLPSPDTHGTAFDPHTWTSPRLAASLCRTMCDALCAIDTINSNEYRQRLDSLLKRINSIDLEIHNLLKDLKWTTFVIAHPALTEFAADYGLTQLSIEKDGKEPTAQWMQTLVEQSRKEQVKVIFMQREFNPDMAETLARETKAHLITINPLSYDWEDELIRIAKALKNGK